MCDVTMTPPSLKPSGEKKHRRRRIGACDLLHPILYHLEKKPKTYQYCTAAQEYSGFFWGGAFIVFTDTANINSNESKEAAENNSSAHKG